MLNRGGLVIKMAYSAELFQPKTKILTIKPCIVTEVKSTEWRPGPTVCRCCLSEGCYKDISTEYFWMSKREVYSEMLAETFDVIIAFSKLSGPNSNIRLICESCISRLRDASQFKGQILECQKKFMQHVDRGISTSVVLDKMKSTEWRPGPTVCRCCSSEGSYKDISTEYFWMGKREVYSQMLAETFDVTILHYYNASVGERGVISERANNISTHRCDIYFALPKEVTKRSRRSREVKNVTKVKKVAKTGAERIREYRARKRALKNAAAARSTTNGEGMAIQTASQQNLVDNQVDMNENQRSLLYEVLTRQSSQDEQDAGDKLSEAPSTSNMQMQSSTKKVTTTRRHSKTAKTPAEHARAYRERKKALKNATNQQLMINTTHSHVDDRVVLEQVSQEAINVGTSTARSPQRATRKRPHEHVVEAPSTSGSSNSVIAFSKLGSPDGNSRLICESCISRLRDASQFKREILECEKKFIQHVDRGNSTIVVLNISVDKEKEVKLEHVKTEKRLSDDDFDDRAGYDDNDHHDEISMDMEKEVKLECVKTEKRLGDDDFDDHAGYDDNNHHDETSVDMEKEVNLELVKIEMRHGDDDFDDHANNNDDNNYQPSVDMEKGVNLELVKIEKSHGDDDFSDRAGYEHNDNAYQPSMDIEKKVNLELVKIEERHGDDEFDDHANNDDNNKNYQLFVDLNKEMRLDRVKVEHFVSDDDFVARAGCDNDDHYDELDDQPLIKLATKVPKEEPPDHLDMLHYPKVAEKPKSSTITKSNPAKKSNKETVQPTPSRSKRKVLSSQL